MDIKKIQEIVNSDQMSDENKRLGIISMIAMDQKAIPDILEILAVERAQKKELISDMNLELSRAHVFIEALNPALLPKGGLQTSMGSQVTKTWILDQIGAFYVKNKGRVKYLFNRFD